MKVDRMVWQARMSAVAAGMTSRDSTEGLRYGILASEGRVHWATSGPKASRQNRTKPSRYAPVFGGEDQAKFKT